VNRLRKIPARLPAERCFCLVDGEAEERGFLEALAGTRTYRIHGSTLQLLGKDGKVLAEHKEKQANREDLHNHHTNLHNHLRSGEPLNCPIELGMAAVVALGLRSVDAGQSISVPLDVGVSAHGSPVLSTSQQTAVDQGTVTSWLLDQPGKYRITARLVAVTGVQRTDLPQQCAITGAPASVEFQVTT